MRTVQNLGRPGLGPHWVEHQDILSPASVIRASFGRMTTDKSMHAFERDHVGQIHLETTFAPTSEMSSSDYTCRYADGERELLPISVFPLELSDTIALQLIPTLFRSCVGAIKVFIFIRIIGCSHVPDPRQLPRYRQKNPSR
jgi:hypothetical protein